MKKRFLAAFISLLMVLTLLPTTALAVEPIISVWVGGVNMRESGNEYLKNNDTPGGAPIPCSANDYNAKYENGVLTLRNFAYTGAVNERSAIYFTCDNLEEYNDEYDLTIVLEGENTVTYTWDENKDSKGILCDGCNLTIKGDGSLTIETEETTDGFNSGITCYSMNICGNVTINATSGSSSGYSYTYCVNAITTIAVYDHATLNATCNNNGIGYGIYAQNISILDHATVNATGGEAQGSYAIYAKSSADAKITLGTNMKITTPEGGKVYNWTYDDSNCASVVNANSTDLSGAATKVVIKYVTPQPTPTPTKTNNQSLIIISSATLTFNTNGGSDISTVSGTAGSVIDLSGYVPTREGYEFTGWFSDEGLTSRITEIKLAGNTTIYAGWQRLASMDNFKQSSTYNGFADVDEKLWYGTENEGSIRSAVLLGLMDGYGDGNFGPEDELKLSEAIKIACMIHSIYTGDEYDFKQSGSWYDVYVSYAIVNGIIRANDFTDYTAVCSRAQAAYIFAHALPASEFLAIKTLTPSDVGSSDEYSDEIYLLYAAGILSGMDENGTFGGDGAFTRSQAAAIATRMCIPGKR